MQVFARVLVLMIFFGSSFIPFGNELLAQNTAVAPIYIDRAIYKAAQEGLICSKETIESLDPSEREARIKVCGFDFDIENEIKESDIEETNIESNEQQASTAEPEIETSSATSEPEASTAEPNSSTVVNSEGEEVSLLPNPEVEFVDEYVLKFDGNKDTIFFGGVVPFVAIPDTELANEDSFFNEESFSVFFYLKRKF